LKRLLLLVPVVVVFVVAGVFLFSASPARVGRPAPAFALPDLADPAKTVHRSDFRGKPLVINFWASWCEPCRTEAPELVRVARKYGGSVQFLGMAMLDGRDAGLAYVAQYKIPYSSVSDARGLTAKAQYGVTGVPETVFVDARGIVVGHYIGAFTAGQLEPIVQRLASLQPGESLEITGHGETRPVP
jgi:cytochrome c biogenesis protein CcmG/thiol:disulfide interchange protein DsbE